MTIRTEIWNDHKIRFVEKGPGDWWAVADEVAKALGYSHAPHMTRRLDSDEKDAVRLTDSAGRSNTLNIISETGIYEAVFGSQKPEAKEFKRWVKHVLKTLREASGLEGFQIFRMLDKQHQNSMHHKLYTGLKKPARLDFIKLNSITNKAISTVHGHPKMVKKADMTPEMLVERQPILEDVTTLMLANESFGLGLSVSDLTYAKYCSGGQAH